MKVYIIIYGCAHDGYTIEGVYQSESSVRMSAIALTARTDEILGSTMEMKETATNQWTCGNYYIKIQQHELQP